MKKNKFLPLLALVMLASCQSATNTNSTPGNTSSSSSSSGSFSYTDELDAFVEEDEIDILSDYDIQEEETLPESYTEIDVSSISSGESYTISTGGTFLLTNENANARIIVDTTDDVTLLLNNVSLTSLTDAPLEVKTANSFTIKALSKTKNYFKDSENNTSEACILVKKVKLTIEGSGYLYVAGKGLSNDTIDSGVGIQAAKGITINDTHILVTESTSHALNSKAGFEINSAKLSLISKKDAIHSKEGGATITSSIINSDTYGDSIDAYGEVTISSSSTHVVTHGEYVLYDASLDTDNSLYEDSKYILENGEYKKISSDDMSRYNTRYYLSQKCKGFKSEGKVSIHGGDYYFYTADDSLASDSEIEILSGDFVFYTLDQAINSDQILNIGVSQNTEDLKIHIYHSYEGIQGGNIYFNSGYVYIESTDDGINATSDTLENVSMNFHTDATVYVYAEGDGIDSNGDITMDGGNLFVFGPTNGGNSSLDYDGTFTYTDGTIFAFSEQGMIETPSTNAMNVASLNLGSYEKNAILSFLIDDYEFSAILPKSYAKLNVIIGSRYMTYNSTLRVISPTSGKITYTNSIYMGEKVSDSDTDIASVSIQLGLTTYGGSNNDRPGGGDNPQPGGNGGDRPDKP